MHGDKYKKNCTQVAIPQVDNTSPCDDFVYSECVIVNRKSKFIKNIENHDLNEYLTLLENKLITMQLRITKLEKIIHHITVNMPEIGIGIYDEE